MHGEDRDLKMNQSKFFKVLSHNPGRNIFKNSSLILIFGAINDYFVLLNIFSRHNIFEIKKINN